MYGLDVDDAALMGGRSWRWLRTRVLSLLDRPPTFVAYKAGKGTRLAAVPSTRLGYALAPPEFKGDDEPTP